MAVAIGASVPVTGPGAARPCRPARARTPAVVRVSAVACRVRTDPHRGGGEASARRAFLGGQANWWSSRQPAVRLKGRTVRAGTGGGDEGPAEPESGGASDGAGSTPAAGGDGTGELQQFKPGEVLPKVELDKSKWTSLGGRLRDPIEVERVEAIPEEERTYEDWKVLYGGPEPKYIIGKFPFGPGYELYGFWNVLVELYELMIWCYENSVSGIFYGVIAAIRPFFQPVLDQYHEYREGRKAIDAEKQAARIALKIQFPKWWMRTPPYLKLYYWWNGPFKEKHPKTYAKGLAIRDDLEMFETGCWEQLRKFSLWRMRWERELASDLKTIAEMRQIVWKTAVMWVIMAFMMTRRNSVTSMVLGYFVCGNIFCDPDLMFGPRHLRHVLEFNWWLFIGLRFTFGWGGAQFPPVLI